MGGLSYTVIDTTKLSTAEVYGQALCRLGEERSDIVALTADLAKSTKIGVFGDKFPERFFNVGIAEQNLFGMAAGLAKAGFTAFASTFAVFTSMRALDQVHTDICYQNLDVKMIATHAGLSFGQAGSTHHCTEDLAIMRSMANLRVLVPADGLATAGAVRAAAAVKGPVYIRINRGFDRLVYGPGGAAGTADAPFEIGKANVLRDGTDLTVIACGSCVFQALDAADALAKSDGLSVRVIDAYSVKPLDEETVRKAAAETRRVITVEDHTVVGGLGSAVAEAIVKGGKACAFSSLGIPDTFSIIGLHEDLLSHYGLDANGIMAEARRIIGRDFEADDDWTDEV